MLLSAILALGLNRGYAAPVDATGLVGTWNVTSVRTAVDTCSAGGRPGDANAYVWIVSATKAGTVSVSVQGTTDIPALTGTFSSTGELTLAGNEAKPTRRGTEFSDVSTFGSSWISLHLGADGAMTGVLRTLGFGGVPIGSGSYKALVPCFSDYELSAKR